MNILVTIDQNYVTPLKVMLCSLFLNNPNTQFSIYLIYEKMNEQELSILEEICTKHKARFFHINANGIFDDAPVLKHYTIAMYYRLLAFKLLPDTLDKILYLDPDMLILNPLNSLYDLPIDSYLFAAASHTNDSKLLGYANQVRLNTINTSTVDYFNSGVMLMNLELQRSLMNPADIFQYVEENKLLLFLPDQDVLNALYSNYIYKIDDSLYNYDARYYNLYMLLSNGEKDMEWMMEHTAILHFCGKRKPWHSGYSGRFNALYKHYIQLSKRL